MANYPFVVVVAGPTAVGKTTFAIELAKKFDAEIINADSRQLYREISIGTAKPNAEELSAIKHHFVNSHSVSELFTTGDFEKQALAIIENQKKAHKKIVIVSGGTGMYINALLNGIDDLPLGNENLRNELKQEFLELGIESLQIKLKNLDEKAFDLVDKSNPQRLMRAIEICKLSGKKYSELVARKKNKREFEIIKIALNTEREILYEQINLRVIQMFENGLLEEVEKMMPYRNMYALKTVGYVELFDYFENKTTFEKAVELIKQHTRNYAKRQLTWFKKDADYKWFTPEDLQGAIAHIESYTKSFLSI